MRKPIPEDTEGRIAGAIAAVALILLFWAQIAALAQGGWSEFFAFWKAYWIAALIAILAVGTVAEIRKGPLAALAMLAMALLLLWFWLAGRRVEWLWDLGALVLASFLTLAVLEGWRRLRGSAQLQAIGKKHEESPAVLVVFVLCFWLLASLSEHLRTRPLPVDSSRFASIRPAQALVPEKAERWRELRIGLALSGGGYRAAVFHAGVLQSLESLGLRVSNLSTVSGGSIIGAYYAIGGDPAEFVQAVVDGRFNLKRRLLQVQHALPLALPMRLPGLKTELLPWWRYDRLDVQASLLRDLMFKNVPVPGSAGSEPAHRGPLLMVAVTDLAYGFQFGLLPDGVLKLGHDGDWDVLRGQEMTLHQEFDLAERVAISGAFPMAFPPRPVELSLGVVNEFRDSHRRLLLADGGIRDNTGYDLLRVAHALALHADDPEFVRDQRMPENWRIDLGLVSDAGALFGVSEESVGSMGLLSRTFDVASVATDAPARHEGCAAVILQPTQLSLSIELLSPDQLFEAGYKQHGQPLLDSPFRDSFSAQLFELISKQHRQSALDRPFRASFSPHWYPLPVVQAMIDVLAGDPDPFLQAEARAAQSSLEALKPLWNTQMRERRWPRLYSDPSVHKACERLGSGNEAGGELPPGACAAIDLRTRMQAAIDRDIEVFRRFSTLDDTPSAPDVRAVERLGRMLVYVRWSTLSRQLDAALECRDASASSTRIKRPPNESVPTG